MDATGTARMGFSTMMDHDAALIELLARDVDGAFPRLVEELGGSVYSGLRRLAGPHDAEDLTQETFIRAYRALCGYDADRIRALRLRGWVWTIALNLGRNHARDRSRRPTLVALADQHPVDDVEPADSEAWDRRLSLLPPAQRRAVVLRHVAGLDYLEISQATGRAEGTVKSDVHRGLERLRTAMEGER